MPGYECRVGRIESDITTYWLLARMAWVATKLYNTAMWHARKEWDETDRIPTGYDLQKVVLASPYHSLLPAHTYQHTAHEVWNAFRSWFVVRKKDPTARPPGFRRKENLSTLMFTEFGFRAVDRDHIRITLGEGLKGELAYPYKWLFLHVEWSTPFPEEGIIKEIEVVPRKGYFELHAKIQLPEPVWKEEGQVVAVDLGMRNPIVSRDEEGNIDIFKGGAVLSSLRYWNKEKSRVKAEVMGRTKGRRKYSRVLARMSKRGSAQVKHAIHSLTSTFAELCDQRNVKEVVVGDLKGIKKEKDGKGKKWNDKASQNWQQFPIREVVAQLDYKLARRGIRLVEQDERGTSTGRCSNCGCTDRKRLHRVHRGLFFCESCGASQNSDINGARNQLARYLHQTGRPVMESSGSLADPTVWRWDDHRWVVV
jgi:putative transposase